MLLGPEDGPALLAYFDESPDDTIWLRIAWADGGARFAGLRRDGRLAAVTAHDRTGAVHVHGAQAPPGLVGECLVAGAPVTAIAGAPPLVEAARAELGMASRAVASASDEIIMSLDLAELVLPDLLSQPGVLVRPAAEDDIPLMFEWRKRYFREVHGLAVDEQALAEVREHTEKGRLWVLVDGGAIVNTASFSAVFPSIVQIEYAYGPPELRAKKYGRSVVAGALALVRQAGVRRAVFNTARTNVAVQTGIHPIGFRKTGDFLVLVFAAG